MFFHSWTGLVRVPIVGMLAYAATVMFIRFSGKCTPAKLEAYDLVVAVALGSTLSSVLLDGSIALAEGTVATRTSIGLKFAFASVRSRRVEGLAEGEPTLLLRDGRFLDAAMEMQRVSLRRVPRGPPLGGRADAVGVAVVVLESDGSMSVLDARPGRAADLTLSARS